MTAAPALQPLRRAPAGPTLHPGHLRATGTLTDDAHVHTTVGATPRQFLHLALQPAIGLPYVASVDLGADPTDHMAAEAMLPHMRRGAMVSVAAAALELRSDHGHAALRMVQPHTVLLLQPTPPTTGA